MSALSDLTKICFRGKVVPEMKRESEIFAAVAAAHGEISAHQHLGELHFNKSNLNKRKPSEGPDHTSLAVDHLSFAARGGDVVSMKLIRTLHQLGRISEVSFEDIKQDFNEMKCAEWSEERESWQKRNQ